MNHAITLGGMFAFLLTLGGIALFALGMLQYFAGAMSDAPEMGETMGRRGCVLAIVGVVVFVLGLVWLF